MWKAIFPHLVFHLLPPIQFSCKTLFLALLCHLVILSLLPLNSIDIFIHNTELPSLQSPTIILCDFIFYPESHPSVLFSPNDLLILSRSSAHGHTLALPWAQTDPTLNSPEKYSYPSGLELLTYFLYTCPCTPFRLSVPWHSFRPIVHHLDEYFPRLSSQNQTSMGSFICLLLPSALLINAGKITSYTLSRCLRCKVGGHSWSLFSFTLHV